MLKSTNTKKKKDDNKIFDQHTQQYSLFTFYVMNDRRLARL